LIDQVQAHKRRIMLILATKEFIFTAGADQKVKQWSMNDLRMVWSLALEWIPTSLTVLNDTVFIGGPSCVFSYKLEYYDVDKLDIGKNEKMTSTFIFKQLLQAKTSFDSVFVIISSVGAVILLPIVAFSIYYYCKRKLTSKQETREALNLASVSNVTQTLVTQILKISLPGYKECGAIEFRMLKRLAEGGGGSVFIGEAFSSKCAAHGKTIIIKKIGSKSC
jgi:hypothetical protein